MEKKLTSQYCNRLLFVLITALLTEPSLAASYYVSPKGKDSHEGSLSKPLASIQLALKKAQPGDRVILQPGDYFQDVHTVTDGTKSQPIQIEGTRDAVIRGAGDDRVFYITHNYVHLFGFTINGLYGDGFSPKGYRDKLLYIHGRNPQEGPQGVKISNMSLENSGGECLRLRYFVHHSEISFSTFNRCGVHDFQFKGKCKNCNGKNGEAIYIGTSSKQWGESKKNPTNEPDQSSDNWVHHNIINTAGNECVDIKEGAERNLISHNICTGQLDSKSAGFDSRGDYNTFYRNSSYSNQGAGFRFGGHKVDGHQYGIGNDVRFNDIHNNANGGIKFQVKNQGLVCQNTMRSNSTGDAVGSYGHQFNPKQQCSEAGQ